MVKCTFTLPIPKRKTLPPLSGRRHLFSRSLLNLFLRMSVHYNEITLFFRFCFRRVAIDKLTQHS
jgi:hypothetical protein